MTLSFIVKYHHHHHRLNRNNLYDIVKFDIFFLDNKNEEKKKKPFVEKSGEYISLLLLSPDGMEWNE